MIELLNERNCATIGPKYAKEDLFEGDNTFTS